MQSEKELDQEKWMSENLVPTFLVRTFVDLIQHELQYYKNARQLWTI